MEKKKKKHWIIGGIHGVLLILVGLAIYGVVSGRLIRVYGNVLRVEKAYFDYDEENTCSLNNPYYKQIVDAIREVSKLETVESRHLSSGDPDFTIHAYNGVRCEVLHASTDFPVLGVVGYVDDKNFQALAIRIFKNGEFTYYYYKNGDEEISRVWDLIGKAEEWEE